MEPGIEGGAEQWIEDVDLENLESMLPHLQPGDFRDIHDVRAFRV